MAAVTPLDLFSGIGAFSLGLGRAGFNTVAFCEIDEWCRRVLAKHWPGVPIHDDARTLDAAWLRARGIERIDAICGGFPCQDISTAGKGAGLDGERSGLWREYARLLGELRPRYAIVENVGALRARGLARVLGDLAALGFDAQWHAVPAAAVGAPHLRDRAWIVAALADSSAQQCGQAQAIAGVNSSRRRPEATGCAATDADGRRRERIGVAQHRDEQGARRSEPDRLGARGWRHGPAAADAPGRGSPQLRGLFGRLARSLAAAQTPWELTAEPPLRRVDDGPAAGVDRRRWSGQDRQRLKALGNAVVPQIPELIGRALLQGAAA